MNKKLAFASAGIVVAAGLFFVARNAQQPPTKQTQGSIYVRTSPKVESVCVKGVQNRSGHNIDMDGVDDEFVQQLKNTGFQAHKLSDNAGACDATVYSEVSEIAGRSTKVAQVDFRLELANEQVPRLSATAKGKSGEAANEAQSAALARTSMSALEPNSKEQVKAAAERQAVLVALSDAAQKINEANKRGLPVRAGM